MVVVAAVAVTVVVVVVVVVAVPVPVLWTDTRWNIIIMCVAVSCLLAEPFCIEVRVVGVGVAGSNSLQPCYGALGWLWFRCYMPCPHP